MSDKLLETSQMVMTSRLELLVHITLVLATHPKSILPGSKVGQRFYRLFLEDELCHCCIKRTAQFSVCACMYICMCVCVCWCMCVYHATLCWNHPDGYGQHAGETSLKWVKIGSV